MPAILPGTQVESWADAMMLRPAGELDPDGIGVPRFALLDTRGPAPMALLLSAAILNALVSLSLVLGRFTSFTPASRAQTVTLLVVPPEPQTPPVNSSTKYSRKSSTLFLQAAGRVTTKPELHGRVRNAGAFDIIPTFGTANDRTGEEQACES